MPTIFLQQIPTTLLPLWAQIILLALVAIAIIQQFRHSTALGEFNIVKESNERLRGELKTTTDELAQVKGRTDLQPILNELKTYNTGLEAWKAEARTHYTGALRRLEEIRAENIEGIKTAQSVLIGIADKLSIQK